MTFDELVKLIPEGVGSTDPRLVEDIEEDTDDGLPDSYKRFLKICRGGFLKRNVWFRSDHLGVAGNFCVDCIFGDGPGYYLTNVREDYWGRIPEELMPIACDPYSNVICLGVSAATFGKVYFWFSEGESLSDEEGLEGATNIYPVATSFEEFVSKLRYEAIP